MQQYDSHISDRELLLAAGGELTDARAVEIRHHLAGCPSCWMRNAELEQTLADVVQAHHREFDGMVPPMETSRALLRARLAQTAETYGPPALPRYRLAWAAAIVVLVGSIAMMAGWPVRRGLAPAAEFAPNAAWTPGSVRPLTRDAVCSAPDRDEPGPVISAAVAREVFHRY
jgi:anti-sigma factor RsiW